MKIVVIGGSGRIGSLVMPDLEKAGHEVINFDILKPQTDKYKFIKGSLTDFEAVEKATRGADVVALLAAYIWDIEDYRKMWEVNLTGSFNVLEAAARNKVKKVVYASSGSYYGIGTWREPQYQYFPIDEKHPCLSQNLYGTGKRMVEELCYMYSMRSDALPHKEIGHISTVCLRFAAVWFPPGRGGAMIATKGLPKGEDPVEGWYENALKISRRQPLSGAEAEYAMQYVGVMDAVQSIRLAVEKDGIIHGVYNIGADESGSELDSLEIARLYFPGVPIRYPELFLAHKKKPLLDITKAQKELGYRPRFHWKDWNKMSIPSF